jgi:GntR family transcriptional regulator, histidine utilization repressor
MVFTKQTSAVGSASPPFQQVKTYLAQELSQGTWLPGQRMPSESELMRRFAVSRMTVNRALRELQAEGLIERTQGVGTFAAALHKVASTLSIHDLQEDIESRGHRHEARVHLNRVEPASAALGEQLGLPVAAPVFHTLILHLEDGMPLQCEDRYVNPLAAPGYLDEDFTRITPTHYLFRHTALWRAQYTVEAASPTAQEAELLQIAPQAPCLIMVRRTMSRSQVITLARLVHPGKRYQLSGEFNP